MSIWKCPLCGKQNSIRYYDPTDYVDDIRIIVKRSLGYARGFEEDEEYSLLDGSDPDLLELISDRIAIIYDMLYEDVEDDEAEGELEDDEEEEDITDLDEEILN